MKLSKEMLSDIRHNLNNDLAIIDVLMAISQKKANSNDLDKARERIKKAAKYIGDLEKYTK